MCVGLMKQAKLIELCVEETRIVGEYFMSSGQFNPAEMLE